MRISQLEGQRVALWGWGREGRAAHHALKAAVMPLTLFCTPAEAADARAVDPGLRIETEATAQRLSRFDVVVKSPGISAYRPEVLAATEAGTRFIGGTALWFAAHPEARTLCVTGTKGKSTTTALLAHLLRAAGRRTALCGNIGLPLLELMDAQADDWAIELSSYQTRDVAASGVRPHLAIVTNVFPEHLDWHGSEQRYVDDKLALLTQARPQVAVLNANDARLVALAPSLDADIRWFGREDGWHLRGDMLHRGDAAVFDIRDVPLPGRHNRGNLCAVLAALDALGLDGASLAPHATSFAPLPHRLQLLGTRDGIAYVNDSISTTPHATLAALDVYRERRVAVLVGGHDRGLDWSAFAEAMRIHAPLAIVAIGHDGTARNGMAQNGMAQNGARIHALLAPLAAEGRFRLMQADGLAQAVAIARDALAGEGVVVLSPGAPSFGAYRDYTERGRHFAALAGFDPQAITAIQGLGIA